MVQQKFSDFFKLQNVEIKKTQSGKMYSDCLLCRSKDKLFFKEDYFFCYGCRIRGNLEKFKKILFG